MISILTLERVQLTNAAHSSTITRDGQYFEEV